MFDGNNNTTPNTQLFITSTVNTSGLVTGTGLSVPFTVTANTVTTVTIPNTFSVHTSGTADNKGIHVSAVNDVTVYGLNQITATTDAYLGLPTDVLGTDYIVATYTGANDGFGIVAPSNGTVVTITPTVTAGGHAAGVPFTVNLNSGQTYELLQTVSTADLTGTTITSNFPIGLMGTSKCTNIPVGFGACDHICEMLPPTTTWGKKFGVVPLVRSIPTAGDTWRFLASQNGTTVKIDGVNQTPVLNKGQFIEKLISTQSVVESDKPILAVQYANGAAKSGQPGDPFMMVIPPFEQFLADYTVITVSPFASQYINIIAPAAVVGSVSLDGVNIPAASFTAIGATGFSGAKITTTTGQHHLTASQPFGIFVYGLNSSDSYGYPGGESFAPVATVTSVAISPITGSDFINNQHCWDATVLDQFNAPVAGVVVHFDITGANPGNTGFATTNASGVAHFCYAGSSAGNDHIVASVGNLTSAADFTWTTCSITVSNCPQDITVSTGPANTGCSQTATWTAPTYSSNCAVTVTSNHQPGDAFPVGTTPVVYTFSAPNTTATCTFNVTVNDNTAPVPDIATLADVTGECSATVLTAPTATDNCTGTVTGTTTDPLIYTAQGNYTIHWTYSDGHGNTSTQTQNVSVHDVTPPSIVCSGNVSASADAGACGANLTITAPVVSDNCQNPPGSALNFDGANDHVSVANGLPSMTDMTIETWIKPHIISNWDVIMNFNSWNVGFVHFQFDPYGRLEFSLNGNNPTDQFTTASFANDQWYHFAAVYSSTGQYVKFYLNGTLIDTRMYSYAMPTAANQPYTIGSWNGTDRFYDGDIDDIRVWNVARSATEIQANMHSTLQGNEAGLVVYYNFNQGTACGNNTANSTLSDLTGNGHDGTLGSFALDGSQGCTSNWSNGAPTTGLTLTNNFNNTDNASGNYPVGTTIVTWTATDAVGNTSTCTQNVVVTDDEAPTITAPAAVTVTADAGHCYASNVALSTPSTHDNCGANPATNDAPATYPVGNTTVTWTVTDIHGNSATATQVVTVTDDENPTIIAPAPVTATADAGHCYATNLALGTPSTNDNCGTNLATNDAPAQFPVGNTTVNWTVTDIHGHSATATQVVTVTDDENPTITAPAPVTATADAGHCYATNLALGTPATNDNCGTNLATNDAPAQFPVGNTTVNWTVTDIHGHSATATQVVTVTDDENPTISAPAAVTSTADAGHCYATNVALGTPATNDNCGTNTATNDAPAQFPVGSTTVNWTVTDIHGHSATATQVVTVTDDENPTIIAPAAVTSTADAGHCYATNLALGTPSTNDNCGTNLATNDAPAQFPVGNTTVNWTVTDIHGHSATATQVVTVTDDENPTIIAPAPVTTTADAGHCYATNLALGTPSTNDNCGTNLATNDAPAQFPVGNTTVNWTVTDIHGHSATATQVVTVTDDENPTISAPGAVTATADAGQCYASNIALGTPATNDNCGVNTATNDAPAHFAVGNTTVTWTVTDIHGHSATATQIVTVTDNENPTITAPGNVVIDGWCTSTTANLGTPTTHDNCGVASVTNDAPATYPVGTTTVTWTVTDIHGHTATATQNVTVNPLTLNLSANVTNVSCNGGNNGAIDLTVNNGTPSYTYNWTGNVQTEDRTGLAAGTYTVAVTDAHACTGSASYTVTQPSALSGSFNTEPERITAGCPGGYILWGYDTDIAVTVNGGTTPYSYNWTAGATGNTATGTYGVAGNPPAAFTVVVTDAHNCSLTLTKNTCITDVRCTNNGNDAPHKITICHKAGNKWNTICVDSSALSSHLAHGDMIGACNLARHGNIASEEEFQVFPNPNNGSFTVTLVQNADSKVVVTDMFGKVVFTKAYSAGTPTINVDMPNVATGMYFLAVQNGDSSFKTKISVE
jgi:hypothetical protein